MQKRYEEMTSHIAETVSEDLRRPGPVREKVSQILATPLANSPQELQQQAEWQRSFDEKLAAISECLEALLTCLQPLIGPTPTKVIWPPDGGTLSADFLKRHKRQLEERARSAEVSQ